MVVDHRGEQVVRRRDRVEVAREVKVDVLHRCDLRPAAAGGAALHSEARSKTWLSQADHRPLPRRGERVGEPDGGGRLALARGRRADARDQHQRAASIAADRGRVDLRLRTAVRLEGLLGYPGRRRDLGDWAERDAARDGCCSEGFDPRRLVRTAPAWHGPPVDHLPP